MTQQISRMQIPGHMYFLMISSATASLDTQRFIASFRIYPVSYTHLDVYKRQFQTLAIGDGRTLIKGHQECAGALISMVNRQYGEENVVWIYFQHSRRAHQVVKMCIRDR